MTENKILIDTSALAKLFGLGTSEQEILMRDHLKNAVIFAPALLRYEIGNTFSKYYDKFDIAELEHDFNLTPINFLSEESITQTIKIAKKYHLSYYDASYIYWLNEEKIDRFYTFDKDFKKVKDKRVVVY